MVVRETLDADSSMWHWIAVDLHFWRSKTGMTLEAVGNVIGLSRGAVSNLEAARYGFKLSDKQAAKLDQLWGLNEHFQRLLRYARAGHDPDWFRDYLKYEARAVVIKIYELTVIPGLLQTQAYARLLFTTAGSKDPEAQVRARMSRQDILTKPNPPQLWVLLDQGVIDRCVGDPGCQTDQEVRIGAEALNRRASRDLIKRAWEAL